jgi:hypothetical protein
MKPKLVLLASVVVGAVAVVVIVVVRARSGPHHHHADTTSVHAAAIDQTDTSVSMTAMLNAPDRATPCETAFAAVEAEQEATKLRATKSIFQWIAPKPDFLAQCQTLTPEGQNCMMPRFRRDHRDECQKSHPPAEVLKKLFVGVPVSEPSYGL